MEAELESKWEVEAKAGYTAAGESVLQQNDLERARPTFIQFANIGSQKQP